MATLTEKMPLVATDAALDRAISERIDRLLDQRLEAKLAELKAAKTPSMTIIATKGTLDWGYPPFILASTAAARRSISAARGLATAGRAVPEPAEPAARAGGGRRVSPARSRRRRPSRDRVRGEASRSGRRPGLATSRAREGVP